MPKIHRIRIVGLKYDGMQKQYKDITFDFDNEETSTNGLISMMNGGGKGVFLQTIFQILKPGTSWGKQNNRYYQQFFFNHKEQFIPYTFHVLIQWELDGADRRHLVTGGMFSAEQRISMSEESGNESKTLEQEARSSLILLSIQENLNGEKRPRLIIFHFMKMMRWLKPKA